MYKQIEGELLPSLKSRITTFDDRKKAVNSFMQKTSLTLEKYKENLGDFGKDAKVVLKNLTTLNLNDINIKDKIETLIEHVDGEKNLTEQIFHDQVETGKTVTEELNALKSDTVSIFQSLTRIGMLNLTMLKLFESLEFSQDKWFQDLNKTTQTMILNQADLMELHEENIQKLEHIDDDLSSITDEIKKVGLIAEYSSSIHHLRNIQNRFKRIGKTDGFKLLESTDSLHDFLEYSIEEPAVGSESSIDMMFRMIFGKNALNSWHIFQILPKLCQKSAFDSIKNLLVNSIELLGIAWHHRRNTTIPLQLQNRWGHNLVRFDELYVTHCGCSVGLVKRKSGQLSKITLSLVKSDDTLTKNLIYVSSQDSLDKYTTQKLVNVLKVFNFQPTLAAIEFVNSFSFEEIETFTKLFSTPALQYHDEKLICINEAKNAGLGEVFHISQDDCATTEKIKCQSVSYFKKKKNTQYISLYYLY